MPKVTSFAAEFYEQDGHKYGKFFLISPKVNSNQWETPPETIAAFARSFIGMPYVSDEEGLTGAAFDHLGLQPPYKVKTEEVLKIQERPELKAGTIIDVAFDPKANEAFATVRFDDTPHGNKVYDELQRGEAIYTSPAITGYAEELPDGRLRYKEWWGIHLARVKKPAYGVMAASLKQTCQGPEKKCVEMLARAASAHGSFCPTTGEILNSSVMSESANRAQKMPADGTNANADQLAQQVKELTDKVASLTQENATLKTQAQTAGELSKKLDDLKKNYDAIEADERAKIANEIADMKVDAELIPKEKRDTEIASLVKLDRAALAAERANIKPYVEKIKALASAAKGQPQSGFSSTRSNVQRTVKQVETASEHDSGSQRGIESLADVSDIVNGRF